MLERSDVSEDGSNLKCECVFTNNLPNKKKVSSSMLKKTLRFKLENNVLQNDNVITLLQPAVACKGEYMRFFFLADLNILEYFMIIWCCPSDLE